MPNSKTLSQTILAAFCAILCALSGMGGGGMMALGARTAAWAKSGYTAKDYVQDGLVAMWDGIENAGWGTHDPNATAWKDLVGTCDLPPSLYFARFAWSTNSIDRVEAYITSNQGYAFALSGEKANNFYRAISQAASTLESCVSRPDYATQYGMGFGYQIFYAASSSDSILANGMYKNGTKAAYGIKGPQMAANINTTPSNAPLYDDFDHFTFAMVRDGDSHTTTINGGLYPATRTFALVDRTSEEVNLQFMNPGGGKTHSIRAYNRALTPAEIAANYAVDKARFGLT